MNVLVTGGSASGKSALAERIAASLSAPCIYVATMRSYGEEGARLVTRHRAQRADLGFLTVELPSNLEDAKLAALCRKAPERAPLPALAQAGAELPRVHEGTVLLEDIGNLVANEMFEGERPDHDPQATAARVCEGIFALMSQCANTVVVTNQLASDGAELDEAMRAYVECVGAVSNRLAARFDTVLECVAGIPLVVKGGI